MPCDSEVSGAHCSPAFAFSMAKMHVRTSPARFGALATHFEQSVTGKHGVPNGRDGSLAIGFMLMHDHVLLDGLAVRQLLEVEDVRGRDRRRTRVDALDEVFVAPAYERGSASDCASIQETKADSVPRIGSSFRLRRPFRLPTDLSG